MSGNFLYTPNDFQFKAAVKSRKYYTDVRGKRTDIYRGIGDTQDISGDPSAIPISTDPSDPDVRARDLSVSLSDNLKKFNDTVLTSFNSLFISLSINLETIPLPDIRRLGGRYIKGHVIPLREKRDAILLAMNDLNQKILQLKGISVLSKAEIAELDRAIADHAQADALVSVASDELAALPKNILVVDQNEAKSYLPTLTRFETLMAEIKGGLDDLSKVHLPSKESGTAIKKQFVDYQKVTQKLFDNFFVLVGQEMFTTVSYVGPVDKKMSVPEGILLETGNVRFVDFMDNISTFEGILQSYVSRLTAIVGSGNVGRGGTSFFSFGERDPKYSR